MQPNKTAGLARTATPLHPAPRSSVRPRYAPSEPDLDKREQQQEARAIALSRELITQSLDCAPTLLGRGTESEFGESETELPNAPIITIAAAEAETVKRQPFSLDERHLAGQCRVTCYVD